MREVCSCAGDENQSLLTPEAVCKWLGIRRSTLYAWVRLRKIPYHKVGSLIRFRRSDILKWLEAREVHNA